MRSPLRNSTSCAVGLLSLSLISCDIGNRQFCFKVYLQGATAPQTCNSAAYSTEHYTPESPMTLVVPLMRGSPPVTVVIETVLLSGRSGGKANVYITTNPMVNGQSLGYSFAPSTTKVQIPGTMTVLARPPLGPSGDLYDKWVLEDNDTERQQQALIQFHIAN